MTNDSLARSYLRKAQVRLDVLDLLLQKDAHSDVVREAQELVELALKAVLRQVGIEPPKWHDVGTILVEHRDRLPGVTEAELEHVVAGSGWLRKERELSFYGDIDFIPTERYRRDDAERALGEARFAVRIAERVIGPGDGTAPG